MKRLVVHTAVCTLLILLGGVFVSTNNGTSWTAVNTGLTNTTVFSFGVSGTNLFGLR